MAKISSVDKISKFNTFDIEKLTRQEKIIMKKKIFMIYIQK